MGSYSNNIKLSKPDPGQCNWDYDWYRNQDINDVTKVQILKENGIISGGILSGASLLSINVSDVIAIVNGTEFSIAGESLSLFPATTNNEETNWIYVNSSGDFVVSKIPPTGGFSMIGMVDTSSTAYIRNSDLRNILTNVIEYEVENILINAEREVNQRQALWASVGAGVYAFDCWYKSSTSGSIEQRIINTSIKAGDKTLFWSGGGSGSIIQSGVTTESGSSPLTLTALDGVQITIVIPENATDVGFIEGNKILPVRKRGFDEELKFCLPYFCKSYNYATAPGANLTTIGQCRFRSQDSSSRTACHNGDVRAPLPMAGTPTVTIYSPNSGVPGKAYVNSANNADANVDGTSRTRVMSGLTSISIAIVYAGFAEWQWTAKYEL
jgi:hypothetical protein